jgi:transposase InsO family protein
LVLDLYSRKIVGWQEHAEERSAADLMTDICQREGVKRHQVTLHSDNGSPMKGATMLATLQQLGIMPSFSRPSVSNDNPSSESLFRTLHRRWHHSIFAVDRNESRLSVQFVSNQTVGCTEIKTTIHSYLLKIASIWHVLLSCIRI